MHDAVLVDDLNRKIVAILFGVLLQRTFFQPGVEPDDTVGEIGNINRIEKGRAVIAAVSFRISVYDLEIVFDKVAAVGVAEVFAKQGDFVASGAGLCFFLQGQIDFVEPGEFTRHAGARNFDDVARLKLNIRERECFQRTVDIAAAVVFIEDYGGNDFAVDLDFKHRGAVAFVEGGKVQRIGTCFAIKNRRRGSAAIRLDVGAVRCLS